MSYTKEQGKQKIKELVDRFRYNLDVYKKSTYNETQVRREFIDPFFDALDWDVSNKQGYAEQYKEVVHEDTIKVGRSTRAPDYSFRIGGQRKFFVEAKKPAVNIKEDVSPSYQLRRYAWSAKLPLSVVTDFEELSVFDCQIKPNPTDKPSIGRIAYYTFDEYLDKFDEIYDIFSKEAILKGSFDRYAQSTKGKKGTAEVDREFLKEIESWRELLAKNIALRNLDVSIYELNYAVQKLVDRIIFLRICEDRGIEHYGQLQTRAEGDKVYTHLLNHFKLAESKYNSGIFDFDADTITPRLHIDDKVLKTIIQDLYYPKSPYEFSVLGVEILGNVYEQFLGKVIRLTAGHQAKVETKPEVKKAGGVYYTPQYIVEYIVENTVGKLIAGKTPEEIAEIKVLDPACGSGSFLIGAYSYLLRYHLDWYVRNLSFKKKALPKKYKEAVFQAKENEWYLTTAEKKRILLDNIFGVDIDSQAVEVTKMSLLLKVLEHESRESIDQQMKLGMEGVLPNLGDNIKCGNSLIGPEYYELGQQGTLFDEEEMRRVNVFDWDDERKGFGENMKRGGFDCVIGNPPYVFGRDWKALNIGDDIKAYLGAKYKSSPYQLDMFSIFMEKASQLCRLGGYVGQIVPNVWLTNTYSSSTRAFILNQATDLCILTPPSNVFPGITVDIVVYTIQKTVQPGMSFQINAMRDGRILELATHNTEQYRDGLRPISTSLDSASSDLVFRLKKNNPELQSFAKITRGVHPYRIGGYGQTAFGSGPQTPRDVKERPYHSMSKKNGYRPFIYGRDLHRFLPPISTEFVKYGPWLAEPRQSEFFHGERVYSRKILGKRLVVTLETTDSVADQQVYITRPKENTVKAPYLAGILGSLLIAFFIRGFYDEINDAFPQIKVGQLKSLPIRTLDFSNPTEKAQHDKLVTLVETMLELHKKHHETRMDRDKELYERQIKIVDAQIDRLVYDLYGLTDEEVKVVETPQK
ncbi:MAG: DNA methyltransferase [Euryarchaeota archaeon]|nr:DNA methyltransferase [Euryarchaeota archaeon]